MIKLNQYDYLHLGTSTITNKITNMISDPKSIVLGGIYSQVNELAEKNLGYYLDKSVKLTNSGTNALMISIEYALAIAGIRHITINISEYMYFSLGAHVKKLTSEKILVNILRSTDDEVTLLNTVIVDEFNIFVVTSHNNINVNIDNLIRDIPDNRRFVIEDRCVVFGIPSNQYTDVACYSFSNNKMITAGEGGCVASNNQEFIEWAKWRIYSNIRPSSDSPYFFYMNRYSAAESGNYFKCSASNFLGIMINAQLEHIDSTLAIRRANYTRLLSELKITDGQALVSDAPLFFPLLLPENHRTSKAITRIQIKCFRNNIQTSLGVNSILGREHKLLNLPIHPSLSNKDLEQIINTINGLI